LGLSPEEIAALNLTEEPTPPVAVESAADELFSFDVAEERPVEKAVRTAPRVEEPPPAPPTEDTGFTPEPLDQLDNIWDISAPAAPAAAATSPPAPPVPPKSETPARVVLPPVADRTQPRPAPRREAPPRPPREPAPVRPSEAERSIRRETGGRSRDDLYARREAATHARQDRPGSRDYGRVAPPARPTARRSFGSFVPTGDEGLDDFLTQLELEPDNSSMALSLARLCAQTSRVDLMVFSYKYLIRSSSALDEVAEEIQDLIGAVDDVATEAQLYRMLGDTFSKQGRLRDAIAAYNHTYGG
jgi:hypothetical protein